MVEIPTLADTRAALECLAGASASSATPSFNFTSTGPRDSPAPFAVRQGRFALAPARELPVKNGDATKD